MPKGQLTEELIARAQTKYIHYIRGSTLIYMASQNYSAVVTKITCWASKHVLTVALCLARCVAHTGCSWTLLQHSVSHISSPQWTSAARPICRESRGHLEYIWSEKVQNRRYELGVFIGVNVLVSRGRWINPNIASIDTNTGTDTSAKWSILSFCPLRSVCSSLG